MGDAYRRLAGTTVVPPEPSSLDLHTHSDRSDGLLSPDRLVAEAAAAGVRVLALTDHDTLAGVRSLAGRVPPGLELVPGVEINSVAPGIPDLREGELHLLGLGVDADDDAFESSLAEQRRRRADRFQRIVGRLAGLGMPVEAALESMGVRADGSALGRPTLARALVASGHAVSVDDAMQRILARGRPGYEPRTGLGPIDAIRAIHAAGGIPVLAHFAEAPERRSLVQELRAAGLRGLEVYYGRFPDETVTALAGLAADLGLIATGGSDHHGDTGTYAESHARLWVPPAVAGPLRAAMAAASEARTPGSLS